MENLLKKIKCFLLDMDGTVHLSGTAINGAPQAVERMREQAKVLFLTNNTSVSREVYVKKLCGMGINCTINDIYTAGNATADYLLQYHPDKKAYVLGTEIFKQELTESGICLTETAPDLVIIAFDTTLTYEKLAKTCEFIRQGVPFLATHPDINCPIKTGFIPDVGSFLALIKKSTGKMPFIICGKPFKPIADGLKKLTGCAKEEIAMVGDRLSTDMVFAQNNGFVSVLVLSGETLEAPSPESGIKPDIILHSIADWDC